MADRSAGELNYISTMRGAGLSEEDYSDDELSQMYREIEGVGDDSVSVGSDSGSDTASGSEVGDEEPSPPLSVEGFRVFLEDKAVEDLRTLSIEDFLSKATLEYTAMGKEQRKSLPEVVRNAQLGHLNAQRYEQLQADLQRLQEIANSSDSELDTLRKQSGSWKRALEQAALGNIEPLQQMVDEYANAKSTEQQQPVDTGRQDWELEKAGREIVETQIRPYLQQVGEQYGFDTSNYMELENYALTRMGQIPKQLQTAQRIERYLTVELPAELEARGYGRTIAELETSRSNSTEVTALQAQLAKMQKEISELRGEKKLDDAPPGSGGASFGGNESQFESADGDFDVGAFKRFLRDR